MQQKLQIQNFLPLSCKVIKLVRHQTNPYKPDLTHLNKHQTYNFENFISIIRIDVGIKREIESSESRIDVIRLNTFTVESS